MAMPAAARPELTAAGYKFTCWGRTGVGFNRGVTGPMIEYWVHPVTLQVVTVPMRFGKPLPGILAAWKATGARLALQQARWLATVLGPRRRQVRRPRPGR